MPVLSLSSFPSLPCLQIIKTATITAGEAKRLQTQMYFNNKEKNFRIKFPLPHRVKRAQSKSFRTIYKANRPSTLQ